MNVFNRFFSQTPVDWSQAYPAKPQFYKKPDGAAFAAIALTEDTLTILPKKPEQLYRLNGQIVQVWKLVLVSTSTSDVIGQADYQKTLKRLKKHILDSNDSYVLIEPLSLLDLQKLLN